MLIVLLVHILALYENRRIKLNNFQYFHSFSYAEIPENNRIERM